MKWLCHRVICWLSFISWEGLVCAGVAFTCFLSSVFDRAYSRRIAATILFPLQRGTLDVLVFILREFQYLLLFFLFILDYHRLAYMFHHWWRGASARQA